MDTPLVSIWTKTYNHAPFIRQCIEGVLMQRTSFPFEFLIIDDASTDETADIIREYETNYPDIIKPIYRAENQFSKKKEANKRKFTQLSRTQGKYIAICEGDDYWTDPLKLQKQVDFLETYPDYSICGGRYWLLYDGETELTDPGWFAKFPKGKTVTLQDYLNPYILQFLTVCFRTSSLSMEKLNQFKYSKDDTYYAILLEQGKGFVFPDSFGVYRKHQGGVWSGMTYEEQIRSNINYFRELALHFGSKSRTIRKLYFLFFIELRFIELKTSQHFFTDCLKIVRYTFSGNIKDIISFHIRFSLRYMIQFVFK